jgi:hypothetical protein
VQAGERARKAELRVAQGRGHGRGHGRGGGGGGGGWAAGWPLANEVQVRPELYLAIPTPRYLVFQTDGLLCADAPLNESALAAYDAFAFVGAPWPPGWSTHPLHASGTADAVGGNGGFSLRDKAVMQRVVHAVPWDGENEDAWLSRHALAAGGRLPPLAAAGAFSFEGLFVTPHALGFHKPWTAVGHAFSSADYAAFAAACPAVERTRAVLELAEPPPLFLAAEAMPIVGLAALLVARLVAGAAAEAAANAADDAAAKAPAVRRPPSRPASRATSSSSSGATAVAATPTPTLAPPTPPAP